MSLEQRVAELENARTADKTQIADLSAAVAKLLDSNEGLRRQLASVKARATLLERLCARLGGGETFPAALARHHITGAAPDSTQEG